MVRATRRQAANLPRFGTSPSIRSGSDVPSAVTNHTGNNIFSVYQAYFSNSPRIMFSKSTDGGATWTNAVAISDNPAGLGVFNPAIASSADGLTLAVAYYDHRDNASSCRWSGSRIGHQLRYCERLTG